MKAKRGLLSYRDEGRAVLRAADPDDGFGFIRERKQEAEAKADAYGHILRAWVRRAYTRGGYDAYCRHCNRIATVNVEPAFVAMPLIYGRALTEPCERKME